MALEKIMPDDMNEVACAMLVYIGENDKQAGRDMSYGDFGKLLQKNHGKRAHGGAYNDCIIHGRADKIHITTISGNEYDMTWNKIAKFIHPYLRSTTVSETVETDTPTPAVNTPTDTTTFDYTLVDDDTAQYLRKATARIANSYADIGAVLAEAQDRLAKHGFGDNNGVFEKWYTSLGMAKMTVYRFIQIHNFRNEMLRSSQFGTNDNALELFDNLPKMLQADISSPSAPAEAVNAVLSGDITTHKDYIALKKELEEAQSKNKSLAEDVENLKIDNARLENENLDLSSESFDLEEERDKLLAELKEAQAQPKDAVIVPDPKQSEEYKSILDERNRMHRQIIETTQENDRLKERCDELFRQTQEAPAPVYIDSCDIDETESFINELIGNVDTAMLTFFRFFKEDYPEEVRDIFRRKAEYIKERIDTLTVMYLNDNDYQEE